MGGVLTILNIGKLETALRCSQMLAVDTVAVNSRTTVGHLYDDLLASFKGTLALHTLVTPFMVFRQSEYLML